jgi:hypothetical protein
VAGRARFAASREKAAPPHGLASLEVYRYRSWLQADSLVIRREEHGFSDGRTHRANKVSQVIRLCYNGESPVHRVLPACATQGFSGRSGTVVYTIQTL